MVEGVRYAATPGDLHRVVELAALEHQASRWASDAFDPAHVFAVASNFMRQPGKTLLVTEGGYIAGMVQHMGFAPLLCALEYAWYSHDGSGLKLLRAFEEWAKSMRARRVFIHLYAGDERASALLGQRRQYKWLGGAMFKELED